MSTPVRVLSTIAFPEELLARLRAVSPRLLIEQHTVRGDEHLGDLYAEVEVLYTARALPQPEQAPRLRWVQLHFAGTDHLIHHPLFTRTDVAFTTVSGIHAPVIAEYVFASILAWRHQLPRLLAYQARAEWPQDRWEKFAVRELRGATLGIVGYGSLGREVARIGQAFGLRVLALKRGPRREDTGYTLSGLGDPDGRIPERFYQPHELRSMLAECDVVVLTVPLTEETRGLIGEAELRAMKPTAYLVNVARGEVVDEAALVRALEAGWIGGAGLDVFAQEPLPPASPLWRLPNVILSPHVSGFTAHYDEHAADLFAANLRRYLAGEPLLNLVDKRLGY